MKNWSSSKNAFCLKVINELFCANVLFEEFITFILYHITLETLECCRLKFAGYNVSRPSELIARYKMLRHNRSAEKNNAPNFCRFKLLKSTESRWRQDGLNNLQYKLIHLEKRRLFTKISVDLLEPSRPYRADCLPMNDDVSQLLEQGFNGS